LRAEQIVNLVDDDLDRGNIMEPGSSRQTSTSEGLSAIKVAELDASVLAAMLLRRLKRALLLRFYTDSLISEHDRRLLDRVIFASFCDCQNAGLAPVAKRLLEEARTGSGLFRRPSGGTGGGSAWSI
jgi:hypothetical protein